MKNKYYIDNDCGLTHGQISMLKKNNQFALRILNQLYYAAYKGNMGLVGNAFKSCALAGELPKSDKVTGVNSNDLGKKIRFLTTALCDEKHPENVATFKNSAFYRSVLAYMSCGYVTDADGKWDNYEKDKTFAENVFAGKNALEAALICNKEDASAPIGLDFSKLIDSIVSVDEKGNYCLKDSTSLEDEAAMVEATNEYLSTLKSSKRFQDNYVNPKLDYENGIE